MPLPFRPLVLAAVTLLALLPAGCGGSAPGAVIAADGVLCDLTERLAAGDLVVRCLLQPGDDPHQFRLTPAQSRDLSGASLVLINGYGLTPALARLPRTLAVAERAVPASPVLDLSTSHAHDAGAGALHGDAGSRDPHVWHDPHQAEAMVRLVAAQLQVLRPSAGTEIAARASAMARVLADLDLWNRRQFATIPGDRVLATGHRAFASLARAYGFRELPVVDAQSGSDSPRPEAFQAVLRDLRRQRVPVLFAEQLPPPRAMVRISALTAIPLAPAPLVADGLAPVSLGGDDLVSTLTANTCRIVEGLRGRCDRRGQAALIRAWRALDGRAPVVPPGSAPGGHSGRG